MVNNLIDFDFSDESDTTINDLNDLDFSVHDDLIDFCSPANSGTVLPALTTVSPAPDMNCCTCFPFCTCDRTQTPETHTVDQQFPPFSNDVRDFRACSDGFPDAPIVSAAQDMFIPGAAPYLSYSHEPHSDLVATDTTTDASPNPASHARQFESTPNDCVVSAYCPPDLTSSALMPDNGGQIVCEAEELLSFILDPHLQFSDSAPTVSANEGECKDGPCHEHMDHSHADPTPDKAVETWKNVRARGATPI